MTIKKTCLSALAILFAAHPSFPASAKDVLYINYAPDVRYADGSDKMDTRIAFSLDSGHYAYGHDFGNIESCSDDNASRCIRFDFFGLHDIPGTSTVGAEFVEGKFRFKVVKQIQADLLGVTGCFLVVEAWTGDVLVNSYWFDRSKGVVALVVPNFSNKEIPASIFFLHGSEGIFAASAQDD